MDESQKAKKWKTLLIALILLVLVAVTAVYVCYRLGVFSRPDERGFIDLMPTQPTEGTGGETEGQGNSATAPSAAETQPSPTESTFEAHPEMTVWDDKQVWTTNTEIELFSITYENGEEVITVASDSEDKVIAPGTDNSYTFRLKNTGNVSLNYSVMLEVELSDNVTYIPMEVRMRDFNGFYCIGSEEEYAPLEELDGLQDHNTLGAGYYAYYTLEWQWPFESGDDEYDTYLGNLATDEPVTVTIVIRTLSAMCDDPDHPGGLLPSTGDNGKPILWAGLAILALGGIVLLVIVPHRKRREAEE